MRVMVLVKGDENIEGGGMPSEDDLATMGRFNEELVDAGIMLGAEGLHPSSKGVRVRFSGNERIVTDGPFTETKELIAGFWIWQVSSTEEAIQWLKRAPLPDGFEVDIRPILEDDDFGEAFTPELREQERRLRSRMEAQKGRQPSKTNT